MLKVKYACILKFKYACILNVKFVCILKKYALKKGEDFFRERKKIGEHPGAPGYIDMHACLW